MNGDGFDSNQIFANTAGLGLIGMSERIKSIGGRFDIQSNSGKGTRLCVELPKNKVEKIVGKEKINILLADDHAILRDGIKMLLSAEKDLTVVGEAKNGEEAIQIARELKPDVVLMDISMPSINGLEAAKQILRFVDTKIILLSMYTDEEYVVQAIRIGVSGYLHKQSAATSLLKAVRAVMNGEAYFSSSISKTILEQLEKTFISS